MIHNRLFNQLNSKEIGELQKLAIEKRLSVGVDFEYRAVPLFMQAKRLISNSFIGDPWLVKLDWLMSSRANQERPWNWYSSDKEGGGVIGALGTHAFDLLHWLIGPTKSINGLLTTSIKVRPFDFPGCDFGSSLDTHELGSFLFESKLPLLSLSSNFLIIS